MYWPPRGKALWEISRLLSPPHNWFDSWLPVNQHLPLNVISRFALSGNKSTLQGGAENKQCSKIKLIWQLKQKQITEQYNWHNKKCIGEYNTLVQYWGVVLAHIVKIQCSQRTTHILLPKPNIFNRTSFYGFTGKILNRKFTKKKKANIFIPVPSEVDKDSKMKDSSYKYPVSGVPSVYYLRWPFWPYILW